MYTLDINIIRVLLTDVQSDVVYGPSHRPRRDRNASA